MAKFYCKHCGTGFEKDYLKDGHTCEGCGKELVYTNKHDVIPFWTRDARMHQIKAMNDIMVEANDENIYMSWIYLVPDCADDEDFADIAVDDNLYNECFDLFIKLIQKDGNRW